MQAPELLFKPWMNGLSGSSVQQASWNSVMSEEVELQRELIKNVVVSGGTTLFEGFSSRLYSELSTLVPAGFDVNISANRHRKHNAWSGASCLAQLDSFASSWISKEEYEE